MARILIVCGGSGARLLGQRGALDIQAELYIDLLKEIKVRQRETLDAFSYSIAVDQGVGTLGLLFQQARQRLRSTTSPESVQDEYLAQCLSHPAETRHLQFLMTHTPATLALEQGIALSPAIGGLVIRHSPNRVALESHLERMTAQLGIGPANPLEVWILSSTAGGVGEGIHRFVGAFVADFGRRRFADTSVTLNFIRIGPSAYHSTHHRRVALNTFFGIAADTAFALKIPEQIPGAATNWFYLDLPDMGAGKPGASERATLVEMAAKAIMLKELRDDLARLLAHNGSIPMVLIRTGFWQQEIEELRKYYEALLQLKSKLQRLLQPDYERMRRGGQIPRYISDEELERWKARVRDEHYILQRIKEGWKFPRYRQQGYPRTLEELREIVAEWKGALEDLLGRNWARLKGNWKVGDWPLEVSGVGTTSPGLKAPGFGQEKWFHQISEAHTIRAWAWHLLGCDSRSGQPRRGEGEKRIEILVDIARQISRTLHPPFPQLLWKTISRRARHVAPLLGEFVGLLAEVDALLRLELNARRFMEDELREVQELLSVTEAELHATYAQFTREYSEYLQDQEIPEFSFIKMTLDRWTQRIRDEQIVQTGLKHGWRLPSAKLPPNLGDLTADVLAWKKALENLFQLQWERMGDFPILSQLLNAAGNWQEKLDKARRVQAWSRHLLGCDPQTGSPTLSRRGYIRQLYNQARKIGRLLMPDRLFKLRVFKPYLRWLSRELEVFVKILAQVDSLLETEREATYALEAALEGQENLLLTKDLSDVVDRLSRTTWLQALLRGARRQTDFRESVLLGISGVSGKGLRHILGLDMQVGVEEIHHEMASRMGYTDRREASRWWTGELEGSLGYEYRILPPTSPQLRESLQEIAREQGSTFRYIFASPNLAVIAFSGISFAQGVGDILTAPMSLLQPLIPVLKETLAEWEYISPYGVPVKQLEVVHAGVCGELLSRIAMAAAGLNEEELERIGQYYRLQ